MSETLIKQEFYGEFDLASYRQLAARSPEVHQVKALGCLQRWFEEKTKAPRGGILVLPTGGGKTFTAMRFLCKGPLSDGYRVLWLAHTHHLLEQAWHELPSHVGQIVEPKPQLRVRVVSGTPGHCALRDIKAADDFLIGTLQTMTGAFNNGQPAFMKFLNAAGERLCVVFDEAHHAPAFSFRKLLEGLRERCGGMVLLGLTATPTYADERKRGWLKKLFPQGIVYQVRMSELQAAGILSRPRQEDWPTEYDVDFDDREYLKWKTSYRDIPEDIITKLAESRSRNEHIAQTYVQNKDRYGKTIIFTDRWFQCDQIREFLRNRGIRADAVYSHVAGRGNTPEERYRRTADGNKKILHAFKKGELDVLINVKMLTEGTDVPDVQTVFLTRQTTSPILLTQMIGRALRGPKFGGTEEAHIVSFVDNWKHLINWADYQQLMEGQADDGELVHGRRPPVRFVSIELVRRLARQMDTGINVAPGPFRTLMPAGWYVVEFETLTGESEDVELFREMILVFDSEVEAYRQFLGHLSKAKNLVDFADVKACFEALQPRLDGWIDRFFSAHAQERSRDNLRHNLFHLARHRAQNEYDPEYFVFEERKNHDLDEIVGLNVTRDLGPRAVVQSLEAEYTRADRFWRVFYPSFQLFKCQYDACLNRMLLGLPALPAPAQPEVREPVEPDPALRDHMLSRDNYRCLCCHEDNRRRLTADHISPSYLGGPTTLENLQTLCRVCNTDKGINEINFRNHKTNLGEPPERLRPLVVKSDRSADPVTIWTQIIRRTFNLFYKCAAVEAVIIGQRGDKLYNWEVSLFPGNDPSWLKPFLKQFLADVQAARHQGGRKGPETLTVTAPGFRPVRVRV